MSSATSLNRGTINCISAGPWAVTNNTMPAPTPTIDCHRNLLRAPIPRGSWCTSFFQSSNQPITPKPIQVPSAIHTNRLPRSAHNRVDRAIEIKMRAPPIVGVPTLLKWVGGPSGRIVSLICKRPSRSIIRGPTMKQINIAVTTPQIARNVRYRNTLNPLNSTANCSKAQFNIS